MTRQALCRVVRGRRKMWFFYNDERRTIHPHIVLRSAEGKVLLNGTEPPRKTWRTYDLAGLEMLGETFRPDTDFHPESGHYYRILCWI